MCFHWQSATTPSCFRNLQKTQDIDRAGVAFRLSAADGPLPSACYIIPEGCVSLPRDIISLSLFAPMSMYITERRTNAMITAPFSSSIGSRLSELAV